MIIGDLIVLAVLALVVGLALRSLLRNRESGGCSCGGDCSSCGSCCHGKQQTELR